MSTYSAFLGFLLAVTQLFVSRCCLSCSDGSVAVTGPPLCCTFLSSWTVFVASPTGPCHVAPTFVHHSLHVTKKPTGWPLFNHCLGTTDQGDQVFGRKVYRLLNSKWEKALHHTVPHSGWSHLHLSSDQFKYGVGSHSGAQP